MARRGGRDSSYRLIRRLMALGLVLLVTVITGLWLMAPPAQLEARYQATDCRVVPITDRAGNPIAGAEALALTNGGATLVLSAYDRLAPPEVNGGLYAVPVFALFGGQVAARPLYTGPGPFRPHGLAISPDGARLALINRYAPQTARIEIGTLDAQGWTPDRRIEGRSLCRANGLTFTGLVEDDLLISLDRADCTASARDLWPGSQTGRLARFDGQGFEIVRSRLSFPNGLHGLHVAETRASRILRPGQPPVELPGGPDNLSRAPDGRLLTAVHPRLHLLGLYLRGWQSRAPTRIVAVDTRTGAVEVLFDDPGGQVFPGATGAVIADGALIAGSVGAPGLLVCGGPGR